MIKSAVTILLTYMFTLSFGQCNVRKESVSDGLFFFKNSKERIFQNEDLENGIQNVFISMGCMKGSLNLLPQDHKLRFDWWIIVDSGADSEKRRVIPRKIVIQFVDGSQIDLPSKYLENPRSIHAVTMQEGYVSIDSDAFDKIKIKEITQILILDTRENTTIICKPYKGILKEQALCLSHEVGY